MVYKTTKEGAKVRFFVNESSIHKISLSDFYAHVDSSHVKIYYYFFDKAIFKTYGNNDNLRYILTIDKKPMSFLSKVDSFVLSKADNLMDSLGYKNLKRTKGATGFFIEVIRTPNN